MRSSTIRIAVLSCLFACSTQRTVEAATGRRGRHAIARSPAAAMTTLQLGTDVTPQPLADMERARRFQPDPSLHFEIDGAPLVSHQSIRLRGYLSNSDSVAHEVIVFPVGPGGFYLGFVPNRGIELRPRQPGDPPAPPAVPPGPIRFEVPAHSRVAIETAFDPQRYLVSPGTQAELEWTYYFWNPPQPTGTLQVIIP